MSSVDALRDAEDGENQPVVLGEREEMSPRDRGVFSDDDHQNDDGATAERAPDDHGTRQPLAEADPRGAELRVEQAEELVELAAIFGLLRQTLIPPHRFVITKKIMTTQNSHGQDEEHLIVLCNDVILIAEPTKEPKTPAHRFDLRKTVPLMGLNVQRYSLTHIFLDHTRENITIVLESEDNDLVKAFFDAIEFAIRRLQAHEIERSRQQQQPRELARSVTRPSRDPRHERSRRVRGSFSEPTAIVRPQPRAPLAPVFAPDEREEHNFSGSEENNIVRVLDDENDTPVDPNDDDREQPPRRRLQPLTLRIEEVHGGEEPEDIDGIHRIVEERRQPPNWTRILRSVFGDSVAAQIVHRRPLIFTGKLWMHDVEMSRDLYRYIVFSDIIIFQKLSNFRRPGNFEALLLYECDSVRQGEFVTIRWPHKYFIVEMDEVAAAAWHNRLRLCVAQAREREESKPEEERYKPVVLGNSVLYPGKTCIAHSPPEPASIGSSEEEQRNAAHLLQLQCSFGVTCDWLMQRRRRLIIQGELFMYDKDGELASRRVVLLSDRLIISKDTEFATSVHHTHDIVHEVDLEKLRCFASSTLLTLRTTHRIYYLEATSPDLANLWYREIDRMAEMVTIVAKRIKSGASRILAEARFRQELERTDRVFQMAAAARASPIIGAHPRDSREICDGNIEEESLDDDIDKYGGASPTPTEFAFNFRDTTPEDLAMHVNSPAEKSVPQMMADLDEECDSSSDDAMEDEEDDLEEDLSDSEFLMHPDEQQALIQGVAVRPSVVMEEHAQERTENERDGRSTDSGVATFVDEIDQAAAATEPRLILEDEYDETTEPRVVDMSATEEAQRRATILAQWPFLRDPALLALAVRDRALALACAASQQPAALAAAAAMATRGNKKSAASLAALIGESGKLKRDNGSPPQDAEESEEPFTKRRASESNINAARAVNGSCGSEKQRHSQDDLVTQIPMDLFKGFWTALYMKKHAEVAASLTSRTPELAERQKDSNDDGSEVAKEVDKILETNDAVEVKETTTAKKAADVRGEEGEEKQSGATTDDDASPVLSSGTSTGASPGSPHLERPAEPTMTPVQMSAHPQA